MDGKIDKKELTKRVAVRLSQDPKETGELVDAVLDEIYDSLKNGESISLRNFGVFYIRHASSGIIFKFNPSQRLRALFGWSSTYKGDL